MIRMSVSGNTGGGKAVQAVLNTILSRTVGDLLIVGERSARGSIPKDTGAGARSIVSSQTGLVGQVSSPLIYVSVMDQGRRPGAPMPPPNALVPWMRRHGLAANLAFVVARAIGRRGIKGHHFFQEAANDMIRALPSTLTRAAMQIANTWKGR